MTAIELMEAALLRDGPLMTEHARRFAREAIDHAKVSGRKYNESMPGSTLLTTAMLHYNLQTNLKPKGTK